MPILAAEPDWFPHDLWENLPAPGGDRRWWCLHTKPRQEKATARQLRSRELSHYLPTAVRESRTPAGRKIKSIVPLFPSYLFLHGDEHARLEAFKGDTLVRVLEVADQAVLDRDLRQIRQVLVAGLPVMAEPTYRVGTWVRINTGPLQGLEGIVDRRGRRDRFVAIVHALGQGASVELEDWQVEPITGDPRP